MKIKIWNKLEPINGVSAEKVLNDNYFFNKDEVILILDDRDIVREIETYSNLQDLMNFRENIPAQELGEKYLKYIEDKKEEAENTQINEEKSKEAFTKAIAELSIENKKKDALISQLAQDVSSLNVKIQQLGGK